MRQFILVLTCSVLAGSCSMYKEVELKSINDVRIVGFGPDGIRLEADAEISNPNAFKVRMTEADIALRANGKYVGQLQAEEQVEVSKKATETVTIKFRLEQEQLSLGLMGDMLMLGLAGKADIQLDGRVTGKVLGVGKSVSINHRETVMFFDK